MSVGGLVAGPHTRAHEARYGRPFGEAIVVALVSAARTWCLIRHFRDGTNAGHATPVKFASLLVTHCL